MDGYRVKVDKALIHNFCQCDIHLLCFAEVRCAQRDGVAFALNESFIAFADGNFYRRNTFCRLEQIFAAGQFFTGSKAEVVLNISRKFFSTSSMFFIFTHSSQRSRICSNPLNK